jgi:hypothetical protein
MWHVRGYGKSRVVIPAAESPDSPPVMAGPRRLWGAAYVETFGRRYQTFEKPERLG